MFGLKLLRMLERFACYQCRLLVSIYDLLELGTQDRRAVGVL